MTTAVRDAALRWHNSEPTLENDRIYGEAHDAAIRHLVAEREAAAQHRAYGWIVDQPWFEGDADTIRAGLLLAYQSSRLTTEPTRAEEDA